MIPIVWELTTTLSPKITGVMAWRFALVFSGTRHNSFPFARSKPQRASAVKTTACLRPASVAICTEEYAASSRPVFQRTLPLILSKQTTLASSGLPTGTMTALPSKMPEPLFPRRAAVPSFALLPRNLMPKSFSKFALQIIFPSARFTHEN